MRGVDEVVRQRLVHVVDDVQLLWRNDEVFLSFQVTVEGLHGDLVYNTEQNSFSS